MASAYGHRREYREWVNPYDVQLTAQVQTYLQQKHDANFEKIQNLLDQYGSMDLYKDEDKLYLYSRLQTLTDKINQRGTMKLDSNGVTRELSNIVKQAVDANVITAYQMTQQARNTIADIAQAKKLGAKGGYSEVNEAEALEPINAWANDGKVGSTFVNRGYKKYVDYKKELQDKMTELYKDSESTIDTPVEGGRFKRTTVKGMTPSEISLYASTLLSDEGKQQQQLDAKWRIYKQSTPEQLSASFNQSLDSSISELKSQLEDVKDKNSTTAVYLKENIDRLSSVKDNYRILDTDTEEVRQQKGLAQANYLQHNADMNGLQAMYRMKTIKETYETDQAYWNQARMNFDAEQRGLDRALKREQMEIDLLKEGLRYNAKTGQLEPIEGGKAGVPYDPAINKATADNTSLDTNDLQNAVDAFQNRLRNLINESDSSVDDLIAKLPKELKSNYYNYYKDNNGEPNNYVRKRVALESVIADKFTKKDRLTFKDELRKMSENKARLNAWWEKDREVTLKASNDIVSLLVSKIPDYQSLSDREKTNMLMYQVQRIGSSDVSLSNVDKKALIRVAMTEGGKKNINENDFIKLTSQGTVLSNKEWQEMFVKYPYLKGVLGLSYGNYPIKPVKRNERGLVESVMVNFYAREGSDKSGDDYLTSMGLKNYTAERLSNLYYQGGTTSFTMPTLSSTERQKSPTWAFVSSVINNENNVQPQIRRNGEVIKLGNDDASNKIRDDLRKRANDGAPTITFNKGDKFLIQIDGYEIVGDMSKAFDFASRDGMEAFRNVVYMNYNEKGGLKEKPLPINSTVKLNGVEDYRNEDFYNDEAGNKLKEMFRNEKLLAGGDAYKQELKPKVQEIAPYLSAMNVDYKKLYNAIDTFVDRGMMGNVSITTSPPDSQNKQTITFSLINGKNTLRFSRKFESLTEGEYEFYLNAMEHCPQALAYDIAQNCLETKQGVNDFVRFLKGLNVDVSLQQK